MRITESEHVAEHPNQISIRRPAGRGWTTLSSDFPDQSSEGSQTHAKAAKFGPCPRELDEACANPDLLSGGQRESPECPTMSIAELERRVRRNAPLVSVPPCGQQRLNHRGIAVEHGIPKRLIYELLVPPSIERTKNDLNSGRLPVEHRFPKRFFVILFHPLTCCSRQNEQPNAQSPINASPCFD